ncbi:hypothetical protein [Haloglomus halophilum]|uniref:hypothetical protein n=1 Tax=Haloglomus halophilum TaxID=2962672 RepID=UPI0020C9A9DC|nr:hypothetical protein [Haloglomus halophilum]
MRRVRYIAPGLALLGLLAVVVGVYQDLLRIMPASAGSIETPWGRDPTQGEYLLLLWAGIGVVGAVAAIRWRLAAVAPAVMGSIVLLGTGNTVLRYEREIGLYTPVPTPGGDRAQHALGAEPFLLVAGALLLVGAGGVGWWAHAERPGSSTEDTEPAARMDADESGPEA